MREITVPPIVTGAPVGGLADVVFQHAREEPDRVVLGRKTDGVWRDMTSGELAAEVLALAKGLLAQGVRFGDRVAVMSRTRYEFTLFDFALWAIGAQPVPVYPTSSTEQVHWILYDTDCTACVVEDEDQAMTVGSVIDRLPHLRRLWQLDAGAVDALVADGRSVADDVVHRHRGAVTPDATATVIYTSGTTGRPKGCVLTHANFMYEADTLVARWESVFRGRQGDRPSTLLFLPLAHVFGRMVEVAAVRARVKLGHQPVLAAAELMPDLAAFRPTFVLGVPHVFEKVFAAARRKAEAEGRTGPSTGPWRRPCGTRRRASRRPSAPGRARRRRCGWSTSSSRSSSTARSARRWAGRCGTPCRAGPRCRAASGCSSTAPGSRCSRGTG